MRIRTQCRECGYPFQAEITPASGSLPCPNCDVARPVSSEHWNDERPASVERCALCDCKHLYRQRDMNRALGCGIVILGAIFVPWTFGLSLVFCSLVDWFLFRRLPNAVVCYRCDTVFRDARPTERQNDFDLLKHDVLKYGKTWANPDGEALSDHH